ncbi:MAG: hypothetical protein HRU20_00045 [Pseudomonadales bacterium]|nr:hypothetical protein [Pseudomonadales bacterium]
MLPVPENGKTLGRTAIHETGHCLSLLHIYASNGACDSSDLVHNTPTAKGQYDGIPTYPSSSSGSTVITMNFMDYVSDETMYIFTEDQKKRMRAVVAKGCWPGNKVAHL